MKLHLHGAAKEVTGSCHLLEVGDHKILLECGLIQGSRESEERNQQPFPFDPKEIDAVILSHAHIDHSGRLPLLVKSGYRGPIYTQRASKDLCRIMLRDSAFLQEKDAEWDNRKRARKGLPALEPLYNIADATATMRLFKSLDYEQVYDIVPGVKLRLQDAGHILGSAMVELWLEEGDSKRKLVFSGDIGNAGMPILRDPTFIDEADLVLMESTYGDRLHRSPEETWKEVHEIADSLRDRSGNILMPAFAVGRSQGILYLLGQYYEEWKLQRWQVFLDSPLAIEATEIYRRHVELHDEAAAKYWGKIKGESLLPNLHLCRTAQQSMQLNRIHSGAIIIAGSGMCNGGRIRHHLKHNIWRPDCHVVITGFQAKGTLGRALVDGAKEISLWGESMRVAATIHTVGGLSAHADQKGLKDWYGHFKGRPPVVLVHGEAEAMDVFAATLNTELGAEVTIPSPGEIVDLKKIRSVQ
jgi:metallo-beta-lactamase family protein